MKQSMTSLWMTRRLGLDKGSRYRKRILNKSILLILVMLLLVLAQLFVSSMVKGIIDKYALLSNGHLQLFTAGEPEATMLERLEDENAISDVQVVIQGSALAYSNTETQMIRIKGVASDYFTPARLAQLHIRYLADEESVNRHGMMISSSMAKVLGVGLGDSLALMVVPDTSTTVVRPTLVMVEGIFDSGYKELDQQLCFISQSFAESLFPNPSSKYVELLVADRNADELLAVEQKIDPFIKQPHVLRTWSEAQPTLYANLMVSQQMILGVFIVVALLAGFFVMSIAQEFIQDDKHTIATMKLLGATYGAIRKIYFSIVFCMTCIALLVGLFLGVLIGMNMGPLLSLLAKQELPVLSWYLLDFTVIIPWRELAILVCVLLIVSVASVLLSLRRIQKITPMELLR